MAFQDRDRCPMLDFAFWEETIPEWYSQGLPETVRYDHYDTTDTDAWFGMDSMGRYAPVGVGLHPGFEWQIVEDRDDHEVVRDWEGVLLLRKKTMGSIPMHLGHTLVDRASWEKEFLHRLDPAEPARIGEEFAKAVADFSDPAGSFVRIIPGPSLYGWIRNWMGMEGVSYLVYDDLDLFEEMVERITQIAEAVYTKAFAAGLQADLCAMWEDMCYSGGSLLTPDLFEKILVPRLKRITDLLKANGVKYTWVDCDGRIDDLIPLWLKGGVNVMFPIEVGTWGADPVNMRKEYGRDLLLMGGVSKRVLAGPVDAIWKEVERLAPLVEEGGYIPMPDHRVPPDVPYSNYLQYMQAAREIWGRNTNLKPCPALGAQAVR